MSFMRNYFSSNKETKLKPLAEQIVDHYGIEKKEIAFDAVHDCKGARSSLSQPLYITMLQTIGDNEAKKVALSKEVAEIYHKREITAKITAPSL